MADSSRVSVRAALETVFGTPPAGGATWKEIPITGINPRTNQETTQSQIIVSDAQIRDIIRTARTGAPDLSFELGYGWFDDILAAALRSDWDNDVLENGTTLRSLSLEVAFLDINQFILFSGLRVGTLGLSVQAGQIVTGTVSFMGKGGAISGSSSAGAFTAAADVTPLNAVDNISLLEEGGSTVLGDALAVELNLNNNPRGRPALGTIDPTGIGLGQFQVEGTLTAYFEDDSLYSKFLGFTPSNLDLEFTDANGNELLIEVLALKYAGGDPDVGGNNEDVDIAHAFMAYRDASEGKTLRITRTDAA